MKQEKTSNRNTLIVLTGLFAAGSVVRGVGRGSRAQNQNSSAGVRVISLDELTQEWQEPSAEAPEESDLPVLWSVHAPRDGLLMLDISGEILERIEGATVRNTPCRRFTKTFRRPPRSSTGSRSLWRCIAV